MTSFAHPFGFQQDILRQRVISLVAYAQSAIGGTFRFPVNGAIPGQLAYYPAAPTESQLLAEAATAMLGAAGAAMVIDQQIGLGLTSAAGDLYWRAGHYYGAFLHSCLGTFPEDALAVAGDLAQRGLGGVIEHPVALIPEQLAYLAVGVAIAGNHDISGSLFRLVPLTTVLGPCAVPVSLIRAGFAGYADNRAGARDLARYLLASYETSQRGMRDQSEADQAGSDVRSDYRRLLPWNVGIPPEVVLMLAKITTGNAVSWGDLALTGEFDTILWSACSEAGRILGLGEQFVGAPLIDLLREWLPQG